MVNNRLTKGDQNRAISASEKGLSRRLSRGISVVITCCARECSKRVDISLVPAPGRYRPIGCEVDHVRSAVALLQTHGIVSALAGPGAFGGAGFLTWEAARPGIAATVEAVSALFQQAMNSVRTFDLDRSGIERENKTRVFALAPAIVTDFNEAVGYRPVMNFLRYVIG